MKVNSKSKDVDYISRAIPEFAVQHRHIKYIIISTTFIHTYIQ